MYTPTLTQLPKICGQQKRWNLLFVLGGITHALKTWSLCGLHPMGNSSHTFKDLILWGSFTKTTWVSSYTLIQHCISNNVYCHKYPLHQDYSHILTQNSNMGLSKTKFFYLKAHLYTYSSITNQWGHVSYYFPIISIHLWMSPFLFRIYFLWSNQTTLNYA
jgi:hypothetical protein